METIIPPGFAQVIHSFTLSGDPEPMAITYGVLLPIDEVFVLNTIAEGLHDAFGDTVLTRMMSAFTLTQTELYANVGVDVNDPLTVGMFALSRVGGQAGTMLPQNSAWLVHKRTGRAGRRGRGRMYLPGVPEGVVSNIGLLESGEPALSQVTWNNFRARFNVAPLLEVVPYLFHTSEAIPPAVVFGDDLFPDPIDTFIVDAKIATQRRRLRR